MKLIKIKCGDAVVITGEKRALNNWTMAIGNVGLKQYRIQFVRFDEPSKFGIKNGHIGKLWIRCEDDGETISYDRGWDKRPKSNEMKQILSEVLRKYN